MPACDSIGTYSISLELANGAGLCLFMGLGGALVVGVVAPFKGPWESKTGLLLNEGKHRRLSFSGSV